MSKTAAKDAQTKRGGLAVERRFTTPGVHPFDEVEWELRDAVIGNPESPAFEQLLGFNLPGRAEVFHKQIAHLRAMPHLFAHDFHRGLEIVFARCGLQEVALLLNRCELRVTLVSDEVEQRVANTLVGNLEDSFPFRTAGVVTELDIRPIDVAELHLEVVITELRCVESDVLLPLTEVIRPIVKRVDPPQTIASLLPLKLRDPFFFICGQPFACILAGEGLCEQFPFESQRIGLAES